MRVTSSLNTVLTPTAVALGNFDGVHRGHQQVIQPILNQSSRAIAPRLVPENANLVSPAGESSIGHIYGTVVTFNPHPQEFFSGQPRPLLAPLPEKVEQLRLLGVDQLVLLPFDEKLAALDPQEFVEKILVQQLQVQRISVGQDFHFGRQRMGTAEDLRAIAAANGISVHIAPLQTCREGRISSSAIRQALGQGDLATANRLLGRSYTLMGLVVAGQQLGRTIGFPTANLQLPPEKFLPQPGVYGVRVAISAPIDFSALNCEIIAAAPPPSLIGIMNIGNRPTVGGDRLTVEVHLLDWSGDLYGKNLTVSLEQFLRPEQKFASLDALKAQIQADAIAARNLLER